MSVPIKPISLTHNDKTTLWAAPAGNILELYFSTHNLSTIYPESLTRRRRVFCPFERARFSIRLPQLMWCHIFLYFVPDKWFAWLYCTHFNDLGEIVAIQYARTMVIPVSFEITINISSSWSEALCKMCYLRLPSRRRLWLFTHVIMIKGNGREMITFFLYMQMIWLTDMPFIVWVVWQPEHSILQEFFGDARNYINEKYLAMVFHRAEVMRVRNSRALQEER